MKNWKTLYKTENLQRAEIIKDKLEENGFHPVLLNKKDSSYLLGYFEVVISNDEHDDAVNILKEDLLI